MKKKRRQPEILIHRDAAPFLQLKTPSGDENSFLGLRKDVSGVRSTFSNCRNHIPELWLKISSCRRYFTRVKHQIFSGICYFTELWHLQTVQLHKLAPVLYDRLL